MDDKNKKIKTVAISEETHKKLIDLQKELKLKKMDALLNKLAGSYIDQRQ